MRPLAVVVSVKKFAGDGGSRDFARAFDRRRFAD